MSKKLHYRKIIILKYYYTNSGIGLYGYKIDFTIAICLIFVILPPDTCIGDVRKYKVMFFGDTPLDLSSYKAVCCAEFCGEGEGSSNPFAKEL